MNDAMNDESNSAVNNVSKGVSEGVSEGGNETPEVVTTDAAQESTDGAGQAAQSAQEAPSVSGTSVSNLREDEPQIEGRIGLDEPLVQDGMQWFVLRVASNKENSVQQTLLRKIQIENMTHLVGRILVPTEKIKTIKGGKTKIKEEKLYAGYVFVEMRLEDDGRIPQDIFFLIKETTGVGDFIGTAGRPTPMEMHEAEKMLLDSRKPEDEPTIKLMFEKGENVTIREGAFENYEGTVDELFPEKGMVRVLVSIFGRQAPVDLEEWQIAKADEG
tara:strand:- start:457930 stop:458748 length:819 start_codon:yes stop_codon:yes gene_type:complete